jgi:hypothetical protein
MLDPVKAWPEERRAELATAAVYGTVLVLAAVAVIDADNVSSGLGWELMVGVGAATWIAHLYAEVVGEHLRRGSTLERHEITQSMVDGLPIILAALAPAVVLLLGRLEVLDPQVAVWVAFAVGFLQLLGLGAVIGAAVPASGATPWRFAAVTGLVGLAVVVLKLLLGH